MAKRRDGKTASPGEPVIPTNPAETGSSLYYDRQTGKRANGQTEGQDRCIWMQAGVVRRKICTIDYDCPACRFDRTLMHIAAENRERARAGKPVTGRRGRIVSWSDRLRERPLLQRPCIHHMKGRIDFRACTNDYRCSNCDFDQYFNDQFAVHAVVRPVEVLDVDGVKAPQGYYLHPGHAWARVEEGASVRIGLDDFILRVLGQPDFIEMPLIGKAVAQGQPGIVLHRGGRSARMRMPVGGVVTALNTRLLESGEAARQDPYSEGWVLQLHARNLREDLKTLMIREETQVFLKKEIDRLYGVIEETAGPLAADGGQIGHDIYGNLPGIDWDRLVALFL